MLNFLLKADWLACERKGFLSFLINSHHSALTSIGGFEDKWFLTK
jgi:hypothetical protein